MQKYFITETDTAIIIHDIHNADTLTIYNEDIPYLITELKKRTPND